jgi:uncharacterized membrane protein
VKSASLALWWDRLRSSYWFVPTIMALAAVGLAMGMLAVDGWLGSKTARKLGYVYSGGADGARGLLSTIAGSVITVGGVVFSITVAALTLASSQFGPRLLRSFMRDLGNQLVLGTFIATFLYCLLVLRTVRGENGDGGDAGFVPHVSVTLAVMLAAASLAVLIYFIHHIARSMQAPYVITAVADELLGGINDIFPEEIGRDAGAPVPDPDGPLVEPPGPAQTIASVCDGYVQSVDNDALMKLACEHDLVVRLLRRPGDYAFTGAPLARVWPSRRLDDDVCQRLVDAFTFGADRTATQDLRFPMEQLVEVAVRAMSPGINDPFTAVNCVDRLGSALALLGGRRIPSRYRRDDEGRLRVIADPVGFEMLTDLAVTPLVHYARASGSVAVTDRLRRTLQELADTVGDPRRRDFLQARLEQIADPPPT